MSKAAAASLLTDGLVHDTASRQSAAVSVPSPPPERALEGELGGALRGECEVGGSEPLGVDGRVLGVAGDEELPRQLRPPVAVRRSDRDDEIEAPGAQHGGVDGSDGVGRHDHQSSRPGLEDREGLQQLVHDGLALGSFRRAEAISSASSMKQTRRSTLPRSVSAPRRATAAPDPVAQQRRVQLDEGPREARGDGAGERGLAGSRRPEQHDCGRRAQPDASASSAWDSGATMRRSRMPFAEEKPFMSSHRTPMGGTDRRTARRSPAPRGPSRRPAQRGAGRRDVRIPGGRTPPHLAARAHESQHAMASVMDDLLVQLGAKGRNRSRAAASAGGAPAQGGGRLAPHPGQGDAHDGRPTRGHRRRLVLVQRLDDVAAAVGRCHRRARQVDQTDDLLQRCEGVAVVQRQDTPPGRHRGVLPWSRAGAGCPLTGIRRTGARRPATAGVSTGPKVYAAAGGTAWPRSRLSVPPPVPPPAGRSPGRRCLRTRARSRRSGHASAGPRPRRARSDRPPGWRGV